MQKKRRQQIILLLENTQQDKAKLCFWFSLPEDKKHVKLFRNLAIKISKIKSSRHFYGAFLEMFSILI